MQASPNRDRILRIGCHCASCSPFLVRAGAGVKVKAYNGPGRIQHRNKRGRVKPKGQHMYRKAIFDRRYIQN